MASVALIFAAPKKYSGRDVSATIIGGESY
jgi:hypothetical protein